MHVSVSSAKINLAADGIRTISAKFNGEKNHRPDLASGERTPGGAGTDLMKCCALRYLGGADAGQTGGAPGYRLR